MPRSRIAGLEFALQWQSPQARHTERVFFEKINFWRGFLAGTLTGRLNLLTVGEGAA
jgi:hypothetical protein